MVPGAGIEPARYFYRGILSPLRLPISPPGRCAVRIVPVFWLLENAFAQSTGNQVKGTFGADVFMIHKRV